MNCNIEKRSLDIALCPTRKCSPPPFPFFSLPPFLALSVCVFQNLCWQNYENHYTLHWLNCERCFTSHAAWTRRGVWNETTTPWCKPPAYPNSFFMQSNCHAVFAGAESLYNWILIKFIFSYLGRGGSKGNQMCQQIKGCVCVDQWVPANGRSCCDTSFRFSFATLYFCLLALTLKRQEK